MILHRVTQVNNGQTISVQINEGKIEKITPSAITDTTNTLQLHLENALIFPGLINSHDHLDFNLFPQLSDRIYKNYTEWGDYIHKHYPEDIARVLKVPAHLRILWGVYKNLICGVTTVVNHGERLTVGNAPITIYENTHDLHSAAFEKHWKLKLNNPLKKKLPVVIHTGEGTDEAAAKEIDHLIYWNKLRRDLVGIHAVAMTEKQAAHFKGIVWCPESNYFLLNKTAPVQRLGLYTHILFGTDSTLTSNWNIWDHINMARKTGLLTDDDLYRSLNASPGKVWGLNTGELAEGRDADIVIAKRNESTTGMDSFYGITPADLLLVIHQGNIRLFDRELLAQLVHYLKGKHFSLIKIAGTFKYIESNMEELIESIKSYLPEFESPVEIIDHQII